MRVLFIAMAGILFSLGAYSQSTLNWKITKPSWEKQDEIEWQEFVGRIGLAVENRQCAKTSDCLKTNANPYRGSDPASLSIFSDCADLPYILRAYFAWKKGLPFSIVQIVKPHAENGFFTKDVRYNKFGNKVDTRLDFTTKKARLSSSLQYPNVLEILTETIPQSVSSGTLRISGSFEDDTLFADFYPVKLDREGIAPGTVIYDPNGHVAVVYKITKDGRVFYIDAHPDNSLTMGIFNPKFVRSHPGQGAGFKKFRPLYLEGAQKNEQGAWVGGFVRGVKNNQLHDYSLEQFYGNTNVNLSDWKQGSFLLAGRKLSFYEYLRNKVSEGPLVINPIVDMKTMVRDLCVSVQDRAIAVQESIKSKLHLKAHPVKLPENIYGTSGEWETYSTPSRDARLKVSFVDLLAETRAMLAKHVQQDPTVQYSGTRLAQDLLDTYLQEAESCVVQYQNSNAEIITLNLEDVRRRLYSLSFDPYHCPELRWGASDYIELQSCRDDANKREWYRRQRWLRYQSERKYDAKMDYSLEQLVGPLPSAGVAAPEDVDIVKFLINWTNN